MTLGCMPSRLPLSGLTMPPRFDTRLNHSIVAARPPLGKVNREMSSVSTSELLQVILL